jgi:hypothetical protein
VTLHPFYKNDDNLLSLCTKYLAHSALRIDGVFRPATEPWHYPLIESTIPVDGCQDPGWNDVTFVYLRREGSDPKHVSVIGTFLPLYEPVPLRAAQFRGKDTRYFSVSVSIPKRQFHTYRFLVDGILECDSINPQIRRLDNGVEWSCFFTEEYSRPSVLVERELRLLSRLVTEITPLRSPDAENFLKRFYNDLDQADQTLQQPHIYRLDDSVGEVNFIDNLLAAGERHHLPTYRLGLRKIFNILTDRHPEGEPSKLPRQVFQQVLRKLQENSFPGWSDVNSPSPREFVEVLRRHTVMGAFTHPRYGGNSAASGWEYLRERFPGDDPSGTCFDWRLAIEKPLGVSDIYFG